MNQKSVVSILVTFYLTFFAYVMPAASSENLVIVGTGSGTAILKALSKAFTDKHPGKTVEIPPSIGSGGGIKAVGNDESIAGRVARELNKNEERYNLKYVLIADTPIVFYVNDSVSMTNITPEQACSIFNGSIRNWEEIGGGNGKIRVIKREEGDSSLLILNDSLPGFKDITLTLRSKTTFTDDETLKECAYYENSITFGAFCDVKFYKGIHELTLSGVHPEDAKYPCKGPLALVYKEKKFNGILKEFTEFIFSVDGKNIIKEAGGIPVE